MATQSFIVWWPANSFNVNNLVLPYWSLRNTAGRVLVFQDPSTEKLLKLVDTRWEKGRPREQRRRNETATYFDLRNLSCSILWPLFPHFWTNYYYNEINDTKKIEIVTLGMSSPFDAVLDWWNSSRQYSLYVWLARATFGSLLQRVEAKQTQLSANEGEDH
jgi:hypothetical protein